MTKLSVNLKLFEAVELRTEYDRFIRLYEELLGVLNNKRDRLFSVSNDDEDKKPAAGFNPKDVEETLKSYQSKKVKLNQAIQAANFTNKIEFDGETITLAEALENRKNLKAELENNQKRVILSAYEKVIHKEERDILLKPAHDYSESYEAFKKNGKKLRMLITAIHSANHSVEVEYKDEI